MVYLKVKKGVPCVKSETRIKAAKKRKLPPSDAEIAQAIANSPWEQMQRQGGTK